MPTEFYSALVITLLYAAAGAFIALSDREPAPDDVVLWSGSYAAAGAGLHSLFLFSPTAMDRPR